MSELEKRIEMMIETGIVSKTAADKYRAIQDILEGGFGITLEEENAASFITHVLLAFERIERGEVIDFMDEAILEEIKASSYYPYASEVTDKIFSMSLGALSLPESERICVIIHLINVLLNT